MPLTDRLWMIELAVEGPPRRASVFAMTKPAEMPVPPTVMRKFAIDVSEATWSGQPMVTARRTSPLSTDGTIPRSRDASRASLVPPSVPVSANTVEPKPLACTALACPVTVCAVPAVGHAETPANAIARAVARHRYQTFLLIDSSSSVRETLLGAVGSVTSFLDE